MLKEFRDFVLRGNLIDLAVAVVIGTAFARVVSELTESFITPLIAAVGGRPDFAALTFTVNGSVFTYGQFLNALIAFLIVAAVLFFLVVKPTNELIERVRGPVDSDRRECPECLSSVPRAASRCSFCTAQIAPAA